MISKTVKFFKEKRWRSTLKVTQTPKGQGIFQNLPVSIDVHGGFRVLGEGPLAPNCL